MGDDGAPQGVPLAGGKDGDKYAGYERAIAMEEVEDEEMDERERAVARWGVGMWACGAGGGRLRRWFRGAFEPCFVRLAP